MKSKTLLLAFLVALLASCTSSYKTGQTPDDVYYSPTRPVDEYVNTEDKDERRYRNKDNNDEYYEDQYLRMKVRNRSRWSEIDDPFYYSRRYNTSTYNCYCYDNPWTPYAYWNNYYNPYYQGSVIVNPKSSVTTYRAPRTFNLNTYNTNALTNSNYTNPKYTNSNNRPSNNNTYKAPRYNETRRDENPGNTIRDLFNNTRSNSSGSTTNPPATNSSSGSSNSSSNNSSGTTAPVRKF